MKIRLIINLGALGALTSLAFLAAATSPASAGSLNLADFDKQVHLIISFQAVTTGGKMLQGMGFPKTTSVLLSSLGTMSLSLAKEMVLDSTYDPADLWTAAIGSSLGVLLLELWPEKSRGNFTFEPEGGLTYILPFKAPESSTPPPSSLMLQAQTTFWYKHRIGLHLFSGGLELGGLRNSSSRKLLFGGGFRVSLYPLISRRKVARKLSAWAGVDYGYLLFAPSDQTVPYVAAGYTPFYSVGMKWKPSKASSFHLSGQAALIPYASQLLLSTGVQAGFEFN